MTVSHEGSMGDEPSTTDPDMVERLARQLCWEHYGGGPPIYGVTNALLDPFRDQARVALSLSPIEETK